MARSRLARFRNARIDLIPALDSDDPFALLTEDSGEPITTEDGTNAISLEQGT